MVSRYHILSVLLLLALAGALKAQDAVGDLLGRINTLRASLGLPAYALNAALGAAAQSQAQWMVDTGEVSHTRPDGSSPRSRAAAAGYGSNWVSENIYMGGLASVDSAWNFWLNSPIHYAGLTNPNYADIGIGAASGAGGHSFVLVFGNPGGLVVAANPENNAGASAGPPPYFGGVDEHGNLKHIVQQDNTLGDIALIYGYTWEDIAGILELNGLTQDDIRYLEVGDILLIPPKAGTYTPTPGPSETPTPEPTDMPAGMLVAGPLADDLGIIPTPTEIAPPPTATPPPSSTAPHIATAQAVPEVLGVSAAITPAPTELSQAAVTPTALGAASTGVPTPVVLVPTESRAGSPTSPWLILAVVVQVGVVLVAAFEFLRRVRR